MDELSIADYWFILKRWKNYFYVAFSVLAAISVIFTLTWSNYRSVATIEVQPPQVAPFMTTPAGMNANDVQQSLVDLRIGRIEKMVTAPSSLVEIIHKFNLYPRDLRHEPMELVAKKMADKIKLTLIGSTIANPAATNKVSVDQLSAIAFTLSFDYSEPKLARQVDNELMTRFLDEDLKERRQEAQATSQFLDDQITTLEKSLAEQENKIAQFEDEHGVSGPAALMFNQQAAASTAANMQSLESQIAANEGTQGSIRAQLSVVDPYSRVLAEGQVLTTPATQLKALEGQYASLVAQYGPEFPDLIKVRRQIQSLRKETGAKTVDTAALKSQIEDVETNIAAAEKTYGPDNPDVVSLKKQLVSLNARLAGTGNNSSSHRSIKEDADNPAYLALMSQLDSLEEQHKSLLDQRTALASEQAKYEAAITRNPGLQQDMAALSRDHDNAEQRYRELKERKLAADMDVQMIQDRKSERLVVISPPDLPLHTHPRSILLFAIGLFFSGLGGGAALVIRQLLSKSIFGASRLTSLVGVSPLVTVPHLYTAEEKSRMRNFITRHRYVSNPKRRWRENQNG